MIGTTHVLLMWITIAWVFLPLPAHATHGQLLGGRWVEKCAFRRNKVPPLAPPHNLGHQLRLLHGVLGVVGHVAFCFVPVHYLTEQFWVYLQKRGIVMSLVLLALFKFFLGVLSPEWDSKAAPGLCESWWDLDRVCCVLHLPLCRYFSTWGFCIKHLWNFLEVRLINVIIFFVLVLSSY